MADRIDVLLELWKAQLEADRHNENQRATLTNIIILVVAAGLGFIAKTGLQPSMLVVTLSILVLGIYGALANWKFHERSAYHATQAGKLRKKIAVQFPILDIEADREETRRKHCGRFPRLVEIELWMLWVALQCAIAVAGADLSAWIIFSSMLVVTLSMLALGIYGALASWKFYKRSKSHVDSAADLRKNVDSAADLRKKKKKLWMLWLALQCAIAVAGAALSAWIIFS
ncbi:hypothetical protein ACFWJ4_13690 [Kitasatospora sp. NPDC127067]|uniref:hypothetical protein n=1 Tax=Kitasatospora sp. NPDC127067 TaxID=3347126 RepID=UPI003646D6D1